MGATHRADLGSNFRHTAATPADNWHEHVEGRQFSLKGCTTVAVCKRSAAHGYQRPNGSFEPEGLA